MPSLLPLFILLPLLLALPACERLASSARPDLDRPASEKAIYLAMGQGLMGKSFEEMARPSRRRALEAEYRALEYGSRGQIVTWQGENNKDFGAVTLGHPYQVGSQNCRQYRHDFTVSGVAHTVSGSACRNGDGSWSPLL